MEACREAAEREERWREDRELGKTDERLLREQLQAKTMELHHVNCQVAVLSSRAEGADLGKTHPGLKRAMEAWTEYLEILQGERAPEAQELAKQQLEEAKKVKQSRVEAERRIEMCKLRRQLLMAWNMFVDAVMETQHNRETVCKVLCRIKHREVAQAFDCYARAVDTLVAQREKVAKTMGRWKSSGVKKAWERWEAYLKDVWQERAHEAQELAKQQLEEAAREAARLELAVLRCEDERRRWHCELTDVKAVADMAVHAAASEKAAFEELEVAVLQWEEQERERERERERQRNTHGAAAFDGFCEAVEQRVAHRRTIAKALSLWQKPLLPQMFEQWVDLVDQVKLDAIQGEHTEAKRALAKSHKPLADREAQRRIEACKCMVRRMLRLELATSLASFRHRVYEVKSKRELCAKIIFRLLHTQLAAAFDWFCEVLELHKTHRKTVERTMTRWRMPFLLQMFDLWLELVEERRALVRWGLV